MKEENQGKRYDQIATEFAKMRDSFYLEQKYLDLFMSYLQPNAHVLDIGCGSGYPIAAYLIEKGFQVTGVDGSKELLNIAKLKCPKLHTVYGDIRTVDLNNKYDGLLEWWCLFHIPKQDHAKMISRFATWIKPDGFLEFTTGDEDYEDTSSDMLNQELSFYSLAPQVYEKYLKENGFKILLREHDQEHHLVWIAQHKS
jgi:2-polyprenyl-3-methyl-5-hydroxy-6-metoxy-1,4-benzoquinol methylase